MGNTLYDVRKEACPLSQSLKHTVSCSLKMNLHYFFSSPMEEEEMGFSLIIVDPGLICTLAGF